MCGESGEWRVVTGSCWWQWNAAAWCITEYMDSGSSGGGGGEVGPQRTPCYNMENMVEMQ